MVIQYEVCAIEGDIHCFRYSIQHGMKGAMINQNYLVRPGSIVPKGEALRNNRYISINNRKKMFMSSSQKISKLPISSFLDVNSYFFFSLLLLIFVMSGKKNTLLYVIYSVTLVMLSYGV